MTKRKSDQFTAMSDTELEYELEDIPITESCDVIRRKIRTLIDSAEMKVGEFQKRINVTSKAYSLFMSQHGAQKGAGSSVYLSAWAFFKKRELQGIKMPVNKKAKKAKKDDDVEGGGGKDKDSGVPSVEDVELEGEMEDEVEVYDTCDDIRRKINAHLKKPGVTQASFLRAASASFHTVPRKLTSGQLSIFRSKKGPLDGKMSGVFYGAYVYFEKLRIKEGKKKSPKREEMEEIYEVPGGLNIKKRPEAIICRPTDSLHTDAYGRLVINGVAQIFSLCW